MARCMYVRKAQLFASRENGSEGFLRVQSPHFRQSRGRSLQPQSPDKTAYGYEMRGIWRWASGKRKLGTSEGKNGTRNNESSHWIRKKSR